jgi:hypothetical protein
MSRLRRVLLLLALTIGAHAARAQDVPDAPPAPDAGPCSGGLCATANDSTCNLGRSDPSPAILVTLAVTLVGVRRRGGRR